MRNRYALSLVTDARARFAADSSSMPNSEWICRNTLLRNLPFSFRKFPFQKQIVDDMHPNLSVKKLSQVGLALDLNTPLPTPTGWTTMGEVREGDQLYGADGKICNVTYTSPVYLDRACYELTFCDGEKITADANHRWFVRSYRLFNSSGPYPGRGRVPSSQQHLWATSGVLTTETLARCFKRGERNEFYIPVTPPLQAIAQQDLPLDPYFLGLWLGNGHAYSTDLSIHTQDLPEILAELTRRGFTCRVSPDSEHCVRVKADYPEGTPKTYARLSQLGLVKNKHIPVAYLRAPQAARFDLLAGLIDTDGSIDKGSGRASFYNTTPALVEGGLDLLRGLGFKPHLRWRPPAKPSVSKSGHVITPRLPIAEISFVPYADTPVSRLERKRGRQKPDGRRTEVENRRIVDIQRVSSRPVRCLTVDASDHLFLAGRGMIATHNTEVQIRKALCLISRNRGRTLLFTFPDQDMQRRTSQTRIQPLVNENPVFNKDRDEGTPQTRSVSIIQVGTSFMMVNSCTEGEATSTPADAVFNDEVDLSDQAILALYNSRMQASDWKISQKFSTPTFSGFGIDQYFETSDQHEYFVKCDSCNHWQLPTYTKKFVRVPGLPDSIELLEIDQGVLDKHRIDLRQSYVACERCGAELDLGRADNRNWVARFPHRTHSRGYQVRPFSTGSLTPMYIITQYLEYLKKGFLRGWYNTVLGETYQDGDIRLTDGQIDACFHPGGLGVDVPPFGVPCFIGIDLGLTCHITITTPAIPHAGVSVNNLRVVLFEAVPADHLSARVQALRQQFLIVGGTVDRHPYTPTANELFDLSGGLIMPVEYRGTVEVRDKIETDKCLQANRTEILDTVAQLVRKQRILFTGYGAQREIIKAHLMDMVREESPEKPAVWKKLSGTDHYFHSLAYSVLAVKLYTGDFNGSEARSTRSSTVYIGGVGENSASNQLRHMIGGMVSRGGAGRVSRLG